MVPVKRSPGKVRFLGKESIPASSVSSREQTKEKTQKPVNTVQVVVQKPSLVDGSGDKKSNNPQPNIENDEDHIVTTLIERPRTMDANPDKDFGARYREIKKLAWIWVQDYFSHVTPEAKRSLDLLHLAHTSPELMEYANWISCCGQKRTWEDVFSEQRAVLVYGILGKMLEVHVFGHEMFGADKEQLRELRELDVELVNRDGTLFLLFFFLFFFPSPPVGVSSNRH